MTEKIEDICNEVPVSDDTKDKAINLYNDTRFRGLDYRIAAILTASILKQEPVSIYEYTSKYNISEEKIISKMNILCIDINK